MIPERFTRVTVPAFFLTYGDMNLRSVFPLRAGNVLHLPPVNRTKQSQDRAAGT